MFVLQIEVHGSVTKSGSWFRYSGYMLECCVKVPADVTNLIDYRWYTSNALCILLNKGLFLTGTFTTLGYNRLQVVINDASL